MMCDDVTMPARRKIGLADRAGTPLLIGRLTEA